MKTFIGAALALLLLSACGSRLDGTYTDPMGISTYTFKSGGKVSVVTMGTEVELDYKVEDNKVKLITPQGALVLTLLDDGSIQGPMGITLSKLPKQ